MGIESIGVRDAFFELGGTSIQAGQFVARLYADLGEEVFVVTLFEKPTIEAFAKMLDSEYESALKRFFGGESSMETAASTVEQHIVTPEIIEKMKHVPTVHLRDDDNSPKNPPALTIGTAAFRHDAVSHDAGGSSATAIHPNCSCCCSIPCASERTHFPENGMSGWKARFAQSWKSKMSMAIRRQMMHDFEQQNLSTKALYAKLQHWLGEQILVDKSPQYTGFAMHAQSRT
ncbi:MAG: phosphopantetheine-binding protein [Calditrichia bacterium]